MLCGQLQRSAIGPAKNHRHLELTARHVESLGSYVDHLVDCQQGEVPGHELDDWSKSNHRRAHADAGEAKLGDRSIDDAHRSEFVEQSLGDLVGAVVLGDFLTHQEYALGALQLFAEGLCQGVAISNYCHQEVVSA